MLVQNYFLIYYLYAISHMICLICLISWHNFEAVHLGEVQQANFRTDGSRSPRVISHELELL